MLNLEKIKSEYCRQVEKDESEEKPKLKLVKEGTDYKPNKENNIYEKALLEVAKNYKQNVTLAGDEYHAYDLFRMIVDYPCRINWNRENGIKIKKGNYKDWDWFKQANLKPNTEQIKDIIAKANKIINKQINNLKQYKTDI